MTTTAEAKTLPSEVRKRTWSLKRRLDYLRDKVERQGKEAHRLDRREIESLVWALGIIDNHFFGGDNGR